MRCILGRGACLLRCLSLLCLAAAGGAAAASAAALQAGREPGGTTDGETNAPFLLDVIGMAAGGISFGWGTAALIVGVLALMGGLVFWLAHIWPISRLFTPSGVTVIHNPLVRQPMEILCQTIDLEQIALVDPGIAAAAATLGYGMGIKGGIARKMLKILHGTPEPATDDFDIDCILLAEPGLTPEVETELRKTVTGMQMGSLVLEPKDVEVISKEGLKTYWLHRDICQNEVVLMRLHPGDPLTLFYSNNALHDAQHNIIRSIPHALKSDFTECWALDGAQPILSPKHVARTIVRYFKGHGASYELGEDTWAFYRRNKLGPITLFQILRTVHADDDKYKEVVAHLINVGLVSGADVRAKGGFNGLWGATLKEVNDAMARYGGRLSLDELDLDAVERWIVSKKARMRSLPYRQRDRASRTGYIPAEEDTLGLGLITFPDAFLEYVEGEGGLWDPEHPEGAPADVAAVRAAARKAQPAALEAAGSAPVAPLPSLPSVPFSGRRRASAASLTANGDLEAATGPASSQDAGASAGWLGRLGGGLVGRILWGTDAAANGQDANGLREPLLAGSVSPGGTLASASAMQRSGGTARAGYYLHPSAQWQGGEEGEVQFIPAQTLVGCAPAVHPDEGRLGMAWLEQPVAEKTRLQREEDEEGGPSEPDGPRPPSRYSSMETLHFMCGIAMAAWPLLLLSSALIVTSVGLHLWQLRVQSVILNLATSPDQPWPAFLAHIHLLARLCVSCVATNWLSSLALQLYLKRAMQQLYTGLFNHVLFQDSTFYDSISASELAMRTGVDMMNLRVLVGFLVQKVVRGLTQLVAGVALLATFAGPALGGTFSLLIGAAVAASVAELVGVSLVVRQRHRLARSALGRLYGFSLDVFSSIHGVVAMALQRTFSESYSVLASDYFSSALVLAMWVASHQLFLEAVFSAGLTVGLMYIGGTSLLSGACSVGSVYALLRYTATVEQGYTALSEAVARFFASYGSLEHVIDLHQRGQLTRRGKPAVLEFLEQEDAARAAERQAAGGSASGEPASAGGTAEFVDWSNWSRRLTAAIWTGAVRMRDVHYGYKGRPGYVLFAASLDVAPGGVALVSGAPGSGRSTLLHLLHLDVTVGGGSVQFFTEAGTWLAYHPTSTDRYEMQQRMGFISPRSCIEAVFFATLQENMVCACAQGRLPSVGDCHEAATLSGLDADMAHLPDGFSTLVGQASRVDLSVMARLRLGVARLLLLGAPRLVLIDDADRFLAAVPRLPEVVARLRQAGAAVVLTSNANAAAGLLGELGGDVHALVLEGGRLRPAQP